MSPKPPSLTKAALALAITLAAFLTGAALEYKLGWLDAIQTWRHQAAALPSPAHSYNARFGNSMSPLASLPGAATDVPRWQHEVRERVLAEITGGLFSESGATYDLGPNTMVGGVIQQAATITSFDGQQLPARFFRPDGGKEPYPAVLLVPGHVSSGESGLLQLAADEASYQHAAAFRLAQAGFVTLTFELRGFGYLGEPAFPEHRAVAYNALQRRESYKSLILKDIAAAMTVLRDYSLVNPDRIGIAGASYGGEVAVQYAALDPAVSAVSFHSYAGGNGRVRALRAGQELPHFCHLFPGVDDWMTQEAWFWLLAPRPVQGVRGEANQHGFLQQQSLYSRAWSDPGSLQLQIESGGHEFFVDAAVAFFVEHL